MAAARRKHWGWGYEHEQPTLAQVRAAAEGLLSHLGFPPGETREPVPLAEASLPEPRVVPPSALREIGAADAHARASHAWGKSYCDVVRGFQGRFPHAPDFVIYPREESDVERALEWCSAERVAAIPYGGGTSVVGGVTPDVDPSYNGAVAIDLGRLDRVLEVDPVSRSARIQGGATGPRLEAQLGEHGLTLRHFPQSFQFSTLGGWIATRAAGHFATVWTHIEDFLESARAIAPNGVWQSRRLPGSGAGPSPDRMLAGSEGILGVVTEAWVRVQPRPEHRSSAAVLFADFARGVECVRALSQSGLHPANCRLVEGEEARVTMAGDGSSALLVLGFESADHPVGAAMDRALAVCDEYGGTVSSRRDGSPDGKGASRASAAAGGVGAWREAFLRAPYVRDLFVALGVLSETFETAITWERFPELRERVIDAARRAVAECNGQAGALAKVTCRFTHVYPDGPAPYFTVLAPAMRGEEVAQWQAIKQAVSEEIIASGATITHHHAVGRDHRPWYDRQRPDLFAEALRAAKQAVDPSGVMNPGVLVDPGRDPRVDPDGSAR